MTKLLHLMTARERAACLAVFVVLLGMGGVEIVGIAAIAGFVALVADPAAAMQNRLIGALREFGGFAESGEFVIAAGLVLFFVIAFRNAYALGAAWLRLSFLHGLRRNLSERLLASYLAQPYLFFLRVNSATLTKNITFEVNHLATTYLYSWITLIADGFVAMAIIALLLWNDPTITLFALAVLGALGGGVLTLLRRRMTALGATHRHWNAELYKSTGEAIGAIKEIKILNRERRFLDHFYGVADRLARTAVAHGLLSEMPRYLLETVVFAGLLVIIFVTAGRTAEITETAGVIALFVTALYRLIPIVHRMISSVNGLFFNQAILDDLSSTILSADEARASLGAGAERLPFQNKIELRDISFQYPGSEITTIKNVSLTIHRGTAVALVGPSGVGKSTLVDIVLGLLQPTAGEIAVDGVAIGSHNLRAWQANIGYVPQEIFLADTTIRGNVALGVPEHEIDEERLVAACKAAHLDEFVATLERGYETTVGERGLRLSGGQRQRIGIARALYRRAELLVLDEATSSLDGITEAVVQDAIRDLAGQMTIITIAHRLQTVRHCDEIHLMEGGRIVASGSYEELMATSQTFRAMARGIA